MAEIILKGRKGAGGKTEGKAMVSRQAFCWFKTVDLEGNIIDERHELYGKNIAGTVFVFPTFRGSTAASLRLYEMAFKGSAPRAIINTTADTVTLSGAILGNIPLAHNFDTDPTEVIETGDMVSVDGDKGVVKITKSTKRG